MPRLSKIGAAALAAFGWTGGQTVSASYLVVAGGGGGGTSIGGGGGAGGLLTGTTSLNPTLSYTITIGAGGAGSTSFTLAGTSGSNSEFNAISSTGGGGGGSEPNSNTGAQNGLTGGSGGGGGSTVTGVNGTGGTATSGQGNAGAAGSTDNTTYRVGGGGGGAGSAGSTGTASTNGAGGAGGSGTASSISGSSVTYAGGGGGSPHGSGTAGAGGSGGGGNSGTSSSATGVAGTANLGGGGGAGGNEQVGAGGKGGSGVVIISYVGAQQFGGGVVTSSGGSTIHTFNTSGTLSPLSSLTASYLIVAGGGSGGCYYGGGGGAGGLLSGSGVVIDTNSTYVITVGAGATAAVVVGSGLAGNNGSNSSFSAYATAAVGGGAGGYVNVDAATTGGSGGGAAGSSSTVFTAKAGTSGQGNAGGTNGTISSPYPTGGGGGGGAVGANGAGSQSGAGGAGTSSSISGTSVTYAGGGGGGGTPPGSAAGAGGSGGGGAGSTGAANGTAGTANTGGGGGGASSNAVSTASGAGGSGIVIISYPGSTQQMAGGTVTVAGGNVIHTFTSSGYLTPIVLVTNSLRFRSSASAYLNRTFATPTNQKIWTWSAWVKRGSTILTGSDTLFSSSDNYNALRFTGSDSFIIYGDAGGTMNIETTPVFRDPAAWYHFVVAFDSTQATASNRVKFYVNGTQVTAFVTATYPSLNATYGFNSAISHAIGRRESTSNLYFDGYLAEVNFIDGQALTPFSFGTTSDLGVWQPIRYGGSYGTNGFYLPFTDNSALTTSSNVGLGKDFSGNANYWTTNNISITSGSTYDSMTDVPTNTNSNTANYCVLNRLDPNISDLSVTISDGNLTASGSTYGATVYTASMQLPSSGKWYYEFSYSTLSTVAVVGIRSYTTGSTDVQYRSDGQKTVGGSTTAYGSSWTTGDVIGVAIDVGAGTITFYKNSVSQGAISIPTPTATFDFAWNYITYASTTFNVNFGQRPFVYTPPTGFVALNTFNLPTPTIGATASTTANKYMDATLYTGNNSTLTVTNAGGFKPDLLWFKRRSGVGGHGLYNSVTTLGASLNSNGTGAEIIASPNDSLTAINSNGFTLGANNNSGAQDINYSSGSTFVAWQWQAGQGTNTSNTNGSITSTVSASTTAGFSIVTYTGNATAGATVGHGLGVTPAMFMVKSRSLATGWNVYHQNDNASPASGVMSLQTTDAFFANSAWNSTTPTSSVFSLGGTGFGVNNSGETYVAYCFAQVAGYSAFGSYTGNGSSDGSFVYLGFRPRFVMIKASSISAENWYIVDATRSPYNAAILYLSPNNSGAEASPGSAQFFDFLSNGFKLRVSGSFANSSGATYIYMAFAENPFKYANAR